MHIPNVCQQITLAAEGFFTATRQKAFRKVRTCLEGVWIWLNIQTERFVNLSDPQFARDRDERNSK